MNNDCLSVSIRSFISADIPGSVSIVRQYADCVVAHSIDNVLDSVHPHLFTIMKHATSYLFKDTYSNFYCLDILMLIIRDSACKIHLSRLLAMAKTSYSVLRFKKQLFTLICSGVKVAVFGKTFSPCCSFLRLTYSSAFSKFLC